MKAKEYLQQLQWLDIVINQKIKEVEDLRLKSKSTSSIDYSKEKVQTSPSKEASFVKLLGRIVDLEAEISQEINIFVEKKHKIINQIQALNNSKYIEVLYKHYVEYKRLEVIAVEMNFTYQYTRELHGHALQDFERTYKNLQKPIENLHLKVL